MQRFCHAHFANFNSHSKLTMFYSTSPLFNTAYIVLASVFNIFCAYVNQDLSLLPTIALAFQTLGVVYGDMGTSPLYVFAGVFSKVPINSDDDVLGALSLVMYTIALIPLAKYVFIVLKANDNGEGNRFTFTLRIMYFDS
jgi:hypothetical protein